MPEPQELPLRIMIDQQNTTDENGTVDGAFDTPRLTMAGEALLTVEFGVRLSPAVCRAVLAFDLFLQQQTVTGLQESAPTGNAVAIVFDPLAIAPKRFRQMIRELVASANWFEILEPAARTCWRLPICYGGDHGPDLAPLAVQLGMSESAIIAAHLEAVQRVFMIGFAPGFLYTGHLPKLFDLPRLPDIKARVPAGTVSVAVGQSVISSTAHPTGWRVIGRTPFRNFDPARDPAILINAGDEIRFTQIDESTYLDLRERDRNGLWQFEKEALDERA